MSPQATQGETSARGPRKGGIDSIEAALEHLRAHFHPGVAPDVSAVYCVELSGPGGGRFWMRLDAGRLSSGQGGTPAPDVLIRASAADFYAFLEGRENPDLLYMEDRIRIDGPLSLALKLRLVFGAPRSRDEDTRSRDEDARSRDDDARSRDDDARG